MEPDLEKPVHSKRKWVLLLAAVLLLFAVGLAVFSVQWMQSKTPITPETFLSIVEGHGFDCNDITQQMQSENNACETALLARAGSTQQAEYYQMANDSAAKRLFANAQAMFEAEKGSTSANTSVNLGKYSSYALTTNGSYYYAARIDQTVILMVAGEEHKSDIKTLVKALGY